jgi:hypothetical protein
VVGGAVNFDELIRALDNLPPGRLQVILTETNDRIHESVQSGSRLGRLTYPKLARCLLFYALSIAEVSRKEGGSKSNYNAPQWTHLAKALNEFSLALPENISRCCAKVYNDDKIAQFSTLSSRARGAHADYFYSTILLFILHLYKEGGFDTDYYKAIASDDDLHLPNDVRQYLELRLDASQSPENLVDQHEINVRFNVLAEETKRLSEFFDHFAFGSDGMLHAMVYRPMRTDPKSLIKTFLVIKPPAATTGPASERQGYLFSHFYTQPKRSQIARFSGGKVVPLADGVYLIGGQRPARNSDIRYPFQSAKIIALRWLDLDKLHPILPAVVMSTDYEGHVLVSRAAMRLTSLSHSSEAELGPVAIVDLETNIEKDLEAERDMIAKMTDDQKDDQPFRNFRQYVVADTKSSGRDIAATISEIANNAPNHDRGWDVPDGFDRRSGKKRDRLDRSRLQTKINDALADKAGVRYSNGAREFDLFRDTRFGPLAID